MTDVKRPIMLQLGSSQDELCKPSRGAQPKRAVNSTRSFNPLMADRSSTCSSQSSSSSSSQGSEVSSPSLILPYLYVGDQAQTQIDTISSLNISYILSLQSLPKFLSGSPQSTPPPTPTTASAKPSQPLSSCSSSSSNSPSSNEAEIIIRPIKLQSAQSKRPNLQATQTKLTHQSSGGNKDLPKFDIIDGADGGLLPSVNSSKDYLVKIKHLANEKDAASKQQDGFATTSDARTTADKEILAGTQPMDIDDDVGSFVEKTQTLSTSLLSSSSMPSCDIYSSSSQPVVGDNTDSDDDIEALESALQDCASDTKTNEQYIDHDEASTSAGGCAVQDDRLVASTGGCSLKQRCNQLSSSVHRLIRGKCINISDTFEQLLDKFFDETHSFIEEARRNKCNVLIHCKAGISRSPTIAIAYLMKWKRLHLQDAYNFVKRCRPQISPNLNFMGQLVSYERQLQRDRSHLPSPTSSCLPSLGMSCSRLQQSALSVPSSSSLGPRAQQQQETRASSSKHGTSNGGESKRGHSVSRRSNNHQNSHINNNSPKLDTNSYDSNNKRARVRCFFRRKS